MWMLIVDDKCVWWIHTCDIWNWLVGELCHNWICDMVNVFDDNYFGNSNEVRFVYVCIYIWCGDLFDNDDCLLITLKWWIVIVELSMLNEE